MAELEPMRTPGGDLWPKCQFQGTTRRCTSYAEHVGPDLKVFYKYCDSHLCRSHACGSPICTDIRDDKGATKFTLYHKLCNDHRVGKYPTLNRYYQKVPRDEV